MLHRAHRAVQLLTEDAAIELAAHETIAVLPAVVATELRDERAHLVRDRSHRLHRARLREIHERPDVKTSRRRMTVESGGQAVFPEQLREPSRILGQPRRIDRCILDEGERALSVLTGSTE